MHRISRLAALGVLAGVALWLHGLCLPVLAKHRIAMGADIGVDKQTVREIQQSFHRVDHAMLDGDLKGLMVFYSDSYSYLGLTKDDMKKMWGEMFRRYRRFITNHSFSQIELTPGKTPTAKVTCSGTLWATSRETGKRVSVDSWLGEQHILVRENGKWKIRGPGKDTLMKEGFGVAVHAFF